MNAVERKAREILAANGETDPHPALLEDTMREVEYHGLVTEAPTQPVYEVVKNEYEVPCEHPACPVMHAHLDNVTFDHVELCEYTDLRTGEQKSVWKRTGHLKTNIEWVIVKDGERAPESGLDEAFDTKRDAIAALKRKGLL